MAHIGFAVVDRKTGRVATSTRGLAIYATEEGAKGARTALVGYNVKVPLDERKADQQARARAAYEIHPVYMSS